MKTIKIKTVGVEFPTNTTTVSLDIVETSGKITKTLDSLTLEMEGLYQNLSSELFDKVLTELRAAGFDVMTTETAE